jgi:hypothetical protein
MAFGHFFRSQSNPQQDHIVQRILLLVKGLQDIA